MRHWIGAAALLAGLAALTACGGKKDPNALTPEENQQLDNAAQMLDASPDSLAVNDDADANGDDGDGNEDAAVTNGQ
jgi:predicted small lipoprotein YifL